MQEGTKVDPKDPKCVVCGRKESEHRFLVTVFIYCADQRTIAHNTFSADRTWLEEGFLWIEDNGTAEGINLNKISSITITDLESGKEE